jgi:hypothetical protein
MTTFTTADREEAEEYLRKQLRIQQNEIDRLLDIILQQKKEIKDLKNKYEYDIDGRC